MKFSSQSALNFVVYGDIQPIMCKINAIFLHYPAVLRDAGMW